MPGTPVAPGVMRRLAEVFERRPDDLSDFEVDFLNSLRERIAKYGTRTYLSDKQAMVVDQIYLCTSAPLVVEEEGDDFDGIGPEGEYVEDDIPF